MVTPERQPLRPRVVVEITETGQLAIGAENCVSDVQVIGLLEAAKLAFGLQKLAPPPPAILPAAALPLRDHRSY